MNLKTIVIALVAITALTGAANARGRCDGFHGCRCGVTQAQHYGLPLSYNGFNLKRAIEWVKAFPHTSMQANVVGYQRGGGPSGHVFRVVQVTGPSTAIVADDKGQYERSMRGATFVDPNGNRGFMVGQEHETVTYHSKRKRHKSAPINTSVDRMTASY